MQNKQLLFGIVGLSIANGIFSPWLLAIFVFHPLWYPWFLPGITEVVVAISSMILSTMTIMAAGVPAALFEMVTGRKQTDAASMAIWFVAAAALTLPALPYMLKAAGLS